MTTRNRPTPTVEDLDGMTKAAILLLSLQEQSAASVLRELTPEQVEKVTAMLATLGEIPDELAGGVVEEFYHLHVASRCAREGGLDSARQLLEASLDPQQAKRIMEQVEQQVQRSPFAFLDRVDGRTILAFIEDEHPQVIAVIVSHLEHEKASEVLSGLQRSKQIEVVRRVANMKQTNPDVIAEVEAGLESRLSGTLTSQYEHVGGVETVAELLNRCDRPTEKVIMDGIEEGDPELVDEIRRLMFVFEDLMLVDDKGIQAMLKEIDNQELALALKTASDELKGKLLGNMSARASELLQEDMEYLGPVRLRDVDTAQQRIVDIVRRLEDAGELMIVGRGGGTEIVP
jgi:flagellar motor switch protein FliG